MKDRSLTNAPGTRKRSAGEVGHRAQDTSISTNDSESISDTADAAAGKVRMLSCDTLYLTNVEWTGPEIT
jgi:hypothetical protein